MEKRNLIIAYFLIEKDLKEILEFIEPSSSNMDTYSHRLFGLYMRTCIEFEANAKMILAEKKHSLPPRPNICDYYLIHNYPEYKNVNTASIKVNISEEITLEPLKDWQPNSGPSWYQDYNSVKHSRYSNFKHANLKNVLNSIGGIYILLYARYGDSVLSEYNDIPSMVHEEDSYIYGDNTLLRIKL